MTSLKPDTCPSTTCHSTCHHCCCCCSPCDPVDPRPYVAALLELRALGWHVTELLPDRDAPRLWRVSIRRFDGYASITVTAADPDDALAELVRYAIVDAEEP